VGIFTQHYSIVPVCIFAFIAAHAVGQGAVIWVFISEIFPTVIVPKAGAWLFHALDFRGPADNILPSMVTLFPPGYVFLFFCGMMVLQLVWVKTMVPETKGVPLEQMQKQLGIE